MAHNIPKLVENIRCPLRYNVSTTSTAHRALGKRAAYSFIPKYLYDSSCNQKKKGGHSRKNLPSSQGCKISLRLNISLETDAIIVSSQSNNCTSPKKGKYNNPQSRSNKLNPEIRLIKFTLSDYLA